MQYSVYNLVSNTGEKFRLCDYIGNAYIIALGLMVGETVRVKKNKFGYKLLL